MTRFALLLPLAAALAVTRPAAAQSRYALTPCVALNPPLRGRSPFVGAWVATWPGVFGTRVSGAVGGLTSSRDAQGTVSHRVGAYTADLDGVFNAAAIPGIGPLLGGFVPALFAGVGVEGGRVADSAAMTSGPVMSYGAIVSRTILGGVGVETEARYRVPTSLDGGAPAAGLTRGWEYRLGLTIGFGGRGGRSASRNGGGGIPLPRWPVASSPSSSVRSSAWDTGAPPSLPQTDCSLPPTRLRLCAPLDKRGLPLLAGCLAFCGRARRTTATRDWRRPWQPRRRGGAHERARPRLHDGANAS